MKHTFTKNVTKLNLFDGVKYIEELESRINGQWNTSDLFPFRGYGWEVFVESYLNVIRKCDEVYPASSIPIKLRKKFKLTGKDLGVDGIFKENGQWFGYQCKYRGDRKAIQFDELGTFYTSSEHLDGRVVITNSNGLGKNNSHVERVFTVEHFDFKKLSVLDFQNIWNFINGNEVFVEPMEPRPHQKSGVRKAKKFFQKNNRGQLHYACASGKTYVSLLIAKAIGARRMVAFVPTLQLATQFHDEWFLSGDPFVSNMKFIFVASDSEVGERLGYSYPVTTDVKTLRKLVRQYEDNGDKYLIISTYQSSKVTCDGVNGMELDFGIYDEAHVTAGHAEKMFSTPLFDCNIKIHKRLFMTATPRIIKARNGTEKEITSMDNVDVYGEVIDTITFRKARELGLITPVELIVVLIDKNLDREEIQKSITFVDGEALRSDMVSCQVGLRKALKKIKVPTKKIITFHNRTKSSTDFIKYGIEKFVPGLDFYGTIDSTMSIKDRQQSLEEFSEAKSGIISNCKCLGIGTNVKSINIGMFVDPKQSPIDIIQNGGRIMRLCSDYKKKMGYIIVPLFVETHKGEKLEDCIDTSSYKTLVHVLEAMISMDETMMDTLNYEGMNCGLDPKKVRGVLRRILGGNYRIIGNKLSVDIIERSIDAMVIDRFSDSFMMKLKQWAEARKQGLL